MDEQAQSHGVHAHALGEGEWLAHEASESLAQRVVPAFDVAGLALAFTGAAMGSARKDLVVGQPEVAPRGAAAAVRRDAFTQRTGTLGGTIPDAEGHDLAGLAAERDPDPTCLCLGADKAPTLVQFQHIARLGRKQGVA